MSREPSRSPDVDPTEPGGDPGSGGPDTGVTGDSTAAGSHTEVVRARGHENVRADHQSTLEVTTDDWLTPAGDCILAVEADRAPASFDPAFVAACRDPEATITARIAVGDHLETVVGRGAPELTFESDRSLVCRTSTYVDDRTVMVAADAAAADLDRAMIDALVEGAELRFELRVE